MNVVCISFGSYSSLVLQLEQVISFISDITFILSIYQVLFEEFYFQFDSAPSVSNELQNHQSAFYIPKYLLSDVSF
jgi:hypothetical protein